MSRYLSGLRTGTGYNDLKKNIVEALERVPLVGNAVIDKLKRTKDSIKQLFIPGMLFENMGITYLGLVDGHNIPALCKVLKEAKKLDHAVLIHVITKRERDINLRRRILPYFTVWVLLILQREKKMGKRRKPPIQRYFPESCASLGKPIQSW